MGTLWIRGCTYELALHPDVNNWRITVVISRDHNVIPNIWAQDNFKWGTGGWVVGSLPAGIATAPGKIV